MHDPRRDPSPIECERRDETQSATKQRTSSEPIAIPSFTGKESRKKRQPDGEIEINEGGRRLVNAPALARIFHTNTPTILGWTKLPDGLPYIRPPSPNPNRKGLRKIFDVDVSLAWYRRHMEHPNPSRKGH